MQDDDLVNPYTKTWFRTLERELKRTPLQEIATLYAEPLPARRGKVPDRLEREVNRIERDKWKLV
ncbi:hypothetical protein BST42_03190 [Mycolicibacterium rhodesiae]|uniref:Uncharacterized protein n=1 Tax=Mycolicibacterium rhodesiae TaxID=36814 RepID=A0A1X0J5T8_MYCRH|nr:hypothetical protein BST42_03190 [Mycolicibacterium rhodesiae]